MSFKIIGISKISHLGQTTDRYFPDLYYLAHVTGWEPKSACSRTCLRGCVNTIPTLHSSAQHLRTVRREGLLVDDLLTCCRSWSVQRLKDSDLRFSHPTAGPHVRPINASVLYTKTMLYVWTIRPSIISTLRACEQRLHEHVSHGVRDVLFPAGCSRPRVRPDAFPRRASAPRAGGSLSLHKQLTYFHSHDRNIRQGRHRSQAQRELRQAEGAVLLYLWLLWWCQQQC